MRYDQYYKCDRCGCALDPGEKCDCESRKTEEAKKNDKRPTTIKFNPGKREGYAQRVVV